MSLFPQIYRSTDPGAPTLNGTVGSMVALLDAILVNGYGTGPTAKAAAGWTTAFTATNKRAYRNNPVSGTGCYLRIDDTGAINNARTAAVKGFSAMSDIDTGLDQIPPVAIAPNGTLLAKSITLDSANRAWLAIATERWVYLFVSYMHVSGGQYNNSPFFAGDIDSRIPGDNANFMVSWSRATSYTSGPIQATMLNYGWSAGAVDTSTWRAGALIAGSDGTRSRWCGLVGMQYGQGSPVCPGSSFGPPYPDPVSGGLVMERPMLMDGINLIRGFFPNLYAPFHPKPFTDGQLVTDVHGFDGVTFLVVTVPEANQSSVSWGQVLIDISSESTG